MKLKHNKPIKEGFKSINCSKVDFGDKFIEEFQKHEISKEEFDFVEVSFLSPIFSFIPKDIFQIDNAERFLAATNPLSSISSIRYNPIYKRNLVVCFEYSEEIEFYFEKKYPFVKIIHNATRLLEKLNGTESNEINLVFHPSEFEMIALKKDVMSLYNIYNFDNIEDILYRIKHYLTAYDLNDKEVILNLYGDFGKINHLQAEIKNQFSNVKLNPVAYSKNFSLIN